MVRSGAIGEPEYLCLQYFVGHTFAAGDWRNDYEYPVLVENATHQFDLIRYICAREPVAVSCAAGCSQRTPHWPRPNVSVHIEMSDGMHAQFDASWSYQEFRTPWEGSWRLHGSKGSILWAENLIELLAGSDRRTVQLPSRSSEKTLAATLAEFTRALSEKDRPAVDISDNMATLSMVFGAIRSASERRTIRIEEMYSD
jgi:predicted dehydrogenase